jgi:hypothetical protein
MREHSTVVVEVEGRLDRAETEARRLRETFRALLSQGYDEEAGNAPSSER